MAVESAADLAAFFNAAEFATAATYYPVEGAPFAVTVLRRRPDTVVNGVQLGIRAPQVLLEVRVSEVAEPRIGDRIDLGGPELVYAVKGPPLAGPERATWELDVEPIASG